MDSRFSDKSRAVLRFAHDIAAEMGYIKAEDKKTILEFRNNL